MYAHKCVMGKYKDDYQKKINHFEYYFFIKATIEIALSKLHFDCVCCKIDTVGLSTSEYLNRFRSGFTLFPMMWTVKTILTQIRFIWIQRLSDG